MYRDARFAFQEEGKRICPDTLAPWCPLPEGGLRIEDANDELNLYIPVGEYETMAGFVLSHLGRIPKQSEQLRYRNLKIVILEMRGMKIERILVTKEGDAAPTS